ncbi:hypothetical protein D1007_14131 [Hordeum vulgare]|nr:hypothetical protein D1007_14131 [Hordeum vulgare]
MGPNVVRRRGALTDALSLLPRLEVDFWDTEARLIGERARLAMRWCHLDVSAKEVIGKAEAVRVEVRREAAEVKAVCASVLIEKEVLTKRCEEAEANFKAL